MSYRPHPIRWLYQPLAEVALGIYHKRLPLGPILCWNAWVLLCINLRWDIWLTKKIWYTALYPSVPWTYWPYAIFWGLSGFWGWGLFQTALRFNLTLKLTEVFTNAGLKNRMGKLPSFVSDFPLDSMNRKMKLTTASFPKSKFEESKPSLESGLQIFIDEIKEARERGLIEITYSHFSMPSQIKYLEANLSNKNHEFLVGATRTSNKISNFEDNPHMLVAGRSGRGKSTFLRQLITHLYLKNKKTQFLLIDLKGGLEFQTFENLPRIKVVGDLKMAGYELKRLQDELLRRFALVRSENCKDIQAYQMKKQKEGKSIDLHQSIVVVDEIAEIFMTSSKATAQEVQGCKAILSQISRLGRAVGIHLVAATQRPDKQALDTQVKANLSGVLCFHMMDDQSSILVLGNGRATDLPLNPGRAIWKDSTEMIEVQTPLLTVEEAEKLLEHFRQNSKQVMAPTATTAPVDEIAESQEVENQ